MSASGPVTVRGEPGPAARLRRALEAAERAPADELTHGFHAYPGRFHPAMVRALLGAFAPGAAVLDPFVGSGTTLIEAMRLGHRALGSDLNPVALALCSVRTWVSTPEERAELVARARQVSERSLERVRKRQRPRLDGRLLDDPARYDPHVFLELIGLREELGSLTSDAISRVLATVLSSIVVKVSRQRADTDERVVAKHIARGFASRLFARKTEELAVRLEAFARAVPPGTSPPRISKADARKLSWVGDGSIECVLTSPPYLGTYDYLQHHQRRFGWLALDPGELERSELGARRRGGDAARGLEDWRADLSGVAAELSRVLSPSGRILVVIGDSAVAGRAVRGDEPLIEAMQRAGLRLVAGATQWRADHRPGADGSSRRGEHLLEFVHGLGRALGRRPQKADG